MQRRWNKKAIVTVIGALVALLYLGNTGFNTYQIDTLLKNTNPQDVWEFVSDFSKMKMLNPTILDFRIVSDSGTYDHWQYSVVYKEKLSHWPYSESLIYADISVHRPTAQTKKEFSVESSHKTCFWNGLYCLYAHGEFKFVPIGPDTYCTEKVRYQCPMLMGTVCRQEVETQRKSIMQNLNKYFTNKSLSG